MTPEEQEKLVKALKIVDLQRDYLRLYGKDWRKVYEEDKKEGFISMD